MLAALALGLQLVPKLRYLESERNNSDGPSRGQKVGADSDTALVHLLRQQQRRARVQESKQS